MKKERFYYYAGICFLGVILATFILSMIAQNIVPAFCALALIPASYTSFVLSKLYKIQPEEK